MASTSRPRLPQQVPAGAEDIVRGGRRSPGEHKARLHNHSLARALAACSRLKTSSAQSGSSASSTRLRVPSAD